MVLEHAFSVFINPVVGFQVLRVVLGTSILAQVLESTRQAYKFIILLGLYNVIMVYVHTCSYQLLELLIGDSAPAGSSQ